MKMITKNPSRKSVILESYHDLSNQAWAVKAAQAWFNRRFQYHWLGLIVHYKDQITFSLGMSSQSLCFSKTV